MSHRHARLRPPRCGGLPALGDSGRAAGRRGVAQDAISAAEDAGTATDGAWPALAPGPAKEEEVDLLYVTRAVMAVSSKVDNPKDFPEHLVDRDPETAWNSRTGDLVGAWIAFRVPRAVTVKRLEIVVGFDKVAKDGTDLFTANHRIKKIAVTRDGKAIGTFELDPEKRAAQSVRLDGPGGEYKVTVLETVPGTRKEWRELAVSELHVLGTTPRHERLGGEEPRVLIGSLDLPAARSYEAYSAAMAAFYPTPEAFCEAQMKHVDLTPSDTARMMGCSGQKKPRCFAQRRVKQAVELAPPFLDVATVSYDLSGGSASTYLLKTSKGWRLADGLGGSWDDDCNPGCPSLFSFRETERIETASSSVPALLVRERFGTYSMGGPDHLVTRTVKICRLEADETLDCDKAVGINERVEIHTQGSADKTAPWRPDVPFTVSPDGKIRRDGDFRSGRGAGWPEL